MVAEHPNAPAPRVPPSFTKITMGSGLVVDQWAIDQARILYLTVKPTFNSRGKVTSVIAESCFLHDAAFHLQQAYDKGRGVDWRESQKYGLSGNALVKPLISENKTNFKSISGWFVLMLLLGISSCAAILAILSISYLFSN